MPVYIDEPKYFSVYHNRRRISSCEKYCHMIAETTEELNAMAEKLGLKKEWIQFPGTAKEHYDILAKEKRRMALVFGAIPKTSKELVIIIKRKRENGN